MAKREGFVPVHNDKVKGNAQIHESQLEFYADLGWKQGEKSYQTTTAAAEKG